jgi:hypothetical protein
MPTEIKERTVEQPRGLFGLLSTIRWEAQFKLAKFCMRASIAISDLGALLGARSGAAEDLRTFVKPRFRTCAKTV